MGGEEGSSKEHSTCRRPNITGSCAKYSHSSETKTRAKPCQLLMKGTLNKMQSTCCIVFHTPGAPGVELMNPECYSS